MKENALVRYLY